MLSTECEKKDFNGKLYQSKNILLFISKIEIQKKNSYRNRKCFIFLLFLAEFQLLIKLQNNLNYYERRTNKKRKQREIKKEMETNSEINAIS